MESYLYTARDLLTQKKVKGELQGESEESVRKILIGKNLYPESIKHKNMLNRDMTLFKPRIKLSDMSFFFKQFAAMLQAGISITKALEICGKQTPNKTLSKHIEHIHIAINEGKTFSQAAEEEKIFSDMIVNLIASGEASGNLDEVMRRAVEYLDDQLTLRKKVKKALAYPTLVLVIVVIVVVILMIKVVPAYIGLLNVTGTEIPLPTQIVIAVSDFFVYQWGILLSFIVGGAVVVLNMRKIPIIKRKLDYLSLKIPIFGNISKKSLTANFSSTMSMLVKSGISMLHSMEITKKVLGNAIAEEEINQSIEALRQGNSLLEAMSNSTIFPPLLLSMVSIGEESGTLDEMLVKMGAFFKEEVEVTVDHLTMLIEPILLMIIAGIIGGIMAAIMLPTLSAAIAII
ncbi:MAG: type II secretion system F family protein [Candidatus Cellulosilyticum pullistercoris]|uniref:Type II secretion system F family protein n=1 Tax=Candidatus Cellulosilyticum pullistercoris TaxID=2838521 RepID=A0A9E2NKN4_9FIRM|nr:type II secretion system F family protein [Candidatus Cellulosilyticum pullistercoris]